MADDFNRPGKLLRTDIDPAPVEVVNPNATSPLLLVCEHAGRRIPQVLGTMGLNAEQRAMHIAYDIGAGQVARALAARLDCRLVLQRYSRLTIDCNRQPGLPNSIPEVSDSVAIPANQNLTPGQIKQREDEIFHPFAKHCHAEMARPEITMAFSIHSFTRQMADGIPRPWDISFLHRSPHSQGARIADLCQHQNPELTVGQNEPYFIDEKTDWFVPVCAEPRHIPHALIEIRNDHIRTDATCEIWADRLYRLFSNFLEHQDAANP